MENRPDPNVIFRRVVQELGAPIIGDLIGAARQAIQEGDEGASVTVPETNTELTVTADEVSFYVFPLGGGTLQLAEVQQRLEGIQTN